MSPVPPMRGTGFFQSVRIKRPVAGYIKPILENYEIIDLSDDDSFVEQAWEVLAGSIMWIFKNKAQDRFASKAPFEGTMKDADIGVIETLLNVLRNAFIEAFEKNVEGSIDFQDAGNVDIEKDDEKGFFQKLFGGSDDD